jgi:diguanylate cyclase (GGDEF)-like protein
MISYLPVFSGGQLSSMPDLAHVSSVSVVRDPLGGVQVWIGCDMKLYSWEERAAGNGVQPVTEKIVEWGEGQGLHSDIWDGVFLDHEGTLWAGGRLHVAALPRHSRRFLDRSIPGSTPGNATGHAPLIEDREGRILAPSEDGIARWNGTGWRNIGRANGLQLSGPVIGMLFDQSGDPWLATRGDGLYNWAGYENWEGWNDSAKLPSAVIWTVVPFRDNRIFVGTDKGPAWIEPRSGNSGTMPSLHRWTYGQLFTMGKNNDGTLWGGTFSAAVLQIDPGTGSVEQVAKLPAPITRSLQDCTGRIFFTTNQGIYVRGPGRTKDIPRRVVAADPLLIGSTQVNAGCQSPDGTVWFMTTNRLIRLQNGRWNEPVIYGESRPAGILLDMSCAPDGSIWITGQQTGTWRMTQGAGGMKAWQLRLPPELQALTPVAIAADRRGWVWLGTDAGLLVWNGREWRQSTQESGLIWNDVNQGAMKAGPDGSLWIGTSGGVGHLLHPERAFDPVPPGVVITNIRNREDIYPATQMLKLPWSQFPLSFQLSSPTMRNRSQLAFEYRMEGLQSNWIESRDGTAVFSSLPPGAYTFTARARNVSLNSFSPTVRVQVQILPPWWKTWWFISLCALGSILAFVLIDRLRRRQLLERSHELEFQVKKRTEELEDRIAQARVAEEKIKKLAFYDSLTHLPNRRLLSERLLQFLSTGARSDHLGALLFIDIDNFKTLNDTLGHRIGDLLLREAARRISACVRESDTVARLGGDEFVVILEGLSQHTEEAAAQARAVAEKILALACQPYQFNGRECLSTSSIGITLIGQQPENTDDVLQRADIAMYQAKQSGGKTLHFFNPALQEEINARAAMEADFREALKEKQFALYFQPQLDCGRLVGVEALIRWRHPRRGLLGPSAFITLAEETGLILPMGDWVLESACRQISAWRKQDRTADLSIAVNISARQLREADFVNHVLAVVDRTGANPANLKLELTESMLVDNIESVVCKMAEVKSNGIGLSLDDFGTGYSSLSYLKRLPLDQLKIDRSFVRDIVEDLGSRAIAQSVISLSQAMNLSVIAEGVETEEQLDCLTGLGCHAFQGFLFGPPLPLEEFELLLPVFSELIARFPAQGTQQVVDRTRDHQPVG